MGFGQSICCDRKKDDLEDVSNKREVTKENEDRQFTENNKGNKGDKYKKDLKSNNRVNTHGNETFDDKLKVFIIYFDHFELVYKLCDDFGICFRPKIIIKTNNMKDQEICIKDDSKKLPKVEDKKETVKKDKQITHNTHSLNSAKIMYNYLYLIKANDFISISFINSIILRITMLNEMSNILPVIVGEMYVQLETFSTTTQEGKISVINKGRLIGYLYIRFQLFFYKSEIDQQIIDIEKREFDEESFKSPVHKSADIVFETYPILGFKELSDEKKFRFVLRKVDKLEYGTDQDKRYSDEKLIEFFYEEKINQFPQNINNFQFLSDLLIDAIIRCQHVVLYELLRLIIGRLREAEDPKASNDKKNWVKNLFIEIDKKASEYGILDIAPIVFESKNFHLLAIYYYTIYQLIIYFRRTDTEDMLELKSFNLELLSILIIDSFGYSTRKMKDLTKKKLQGEILLEMREIVYWLLNILNILIIPNISIKITNIPTLTKLYYFAYNNCLKIVTRPKFIVSSYYDFVYDSEIISLLIRLFRKAIQTGLDHKHNLLLKTDNPKLVANNIKNTLAMEKKNEYFLTFLKMSLNQVKHYPEVYCNLFIIVNQFTMDYNNQRLIMSIAKYFSISWIRNTFDPYRGTLKNVSKQVNILFYKYISYVSGLIKSDIADENELNLSFDEVQEIVNEIKILFKMSINRDSMKIEISKSLKEYLKMKTLELHEIFTYIAVALMRSRRACLELCSRKCYFIYHLMDFLMEIKKEKLLEDLEHAKIKGGKDESIYMYISIFDNTILCLDNLITKDYTSRDYFVEMLKIMNLTKSQFRFQCIDIIHLFGTIFNFTNEKLKKCFENFKENLDSL